MEPSHWDTTKIFVNIPSSIFCTNELHVAMIYVFILIIDCSRNTPNWSFELSILHIPHVLVLLRSRPLAPDFHIRHVSLCQATLSIQRKPHLITKSLSKKIKFQCQTPGTDNLSVPIAHTAQGRRRSAVPPTGALAVPSAHHEPGCTELNTQYPVVRAGFVASTPSLPKTFRLWARFLACDKAQYRCELPGRGYKPGSSPEWSMNDQRHRQHQVPMPWW